MFKLKPLVRAVRYSIYYQLVNQFKKERLTKKETHHVT